MSIINEALKKTEEHLQKNAAKNNPLPSNPSRPKPFILYILILLAGLLLSSFIFNQLNRKIQTTQALKKKTLVVIQAAIPIPPPVLPSPPTEEKKPTPPASFILNGIYFSDSNGYALVNNQIVRENDYVDGAKVSLITANTVQLDNAGETITLSTHK